MRSAIRTTANAATRASNSKWRRIFAGLPFDVRAITLGTFLDAAPAGTWAISAGNHFVAYADGFVADSGAWFSRKPALWTRANPDHDRVALRRVREAVRFVPVSLNAARSGPIQQEG